MKYYHILQSNDQPFLMTKLQVQIEGTWLVQFRSTEEIFKPGYITLYKIIFGYCDIDPNNYLDLIGQTRTSYKLRPKIFHTNYFKFSFFNRYVIDWNSLPSYVVNSSRITTFKKALKAYLET